MKRISLLILLITSINFSNGQVTGAAPSGEAGLFGSAQGGTPMLNLVMMDIRNRKNTQSQYIGEVVGSPYLTENFIKSKLFYDEELMGDFYMRYNALNSEIEIKESNLKEEEPKRLLADKRLTVRYQNKVLRFTTYITKKDETKNGYLSMLVSGDKYKLYHRLAVKYSEGKAAANSMVNPIPSRFAHFVEYYYQKEGVDRIDQLSQKKGKFLKQLDKDIRENVKLFLSENKLDLGKEQDLVKAFEYINTL
ncbi:MAG: hypothetical protein AB3N14_18145 [Flavobacteriaceae bacterium]